MPLFRRERLHERLARQGGLAEESVAPHDPRPRWGEAGIHGIHRPREWDAVLTAEAPGLVSAETEFAVLGDGTLILDEELSPDALEPLVEAVDSVLEAPYEVKAIRQHEEVWAVAARSIEVVSLPDLAGDELTLTVRDGSRTLEIDGRPEFGSVPPLERLAAERFASFVASASRLAGDLWSFRVSPL